MGRIQHAVLDELDRSFDINVISLLQLVQTLFPKKEEIPAGTRIMMAAARAAYHPPARFLGLTPSRIAQRVIAELLHENLARHAFAFSVFSINCAIDEPRMRAIYTDKPTSFFIQPDDIARAMVSLFDGETLSSPRKYGASRRLSNSIRPRQRQPPS